MGDEGNTIRLGFDRWEREREREREGGCVYVCVSMRPKEESRGRHGMVLTAFGRNHHSDDKSRYPRTSCRGLLHHRTCSKVDRLSLDHRVEG
jgi:hypothetical protein